MLLVLGLLREIFYKIRITLNKSKRITYQKTRIISKKNGVCEPEELIKYIKYYASTNTSWYPNWKDQISKYSKIPDLLLIDVIEKIQYNYERKIYLEWLINELSRYPVNGTFDIHEVGYVRDFKRLALDRYKVCLDQENTQIINKVSKSSDKRGYHNKDNQIIPEDALYEEAKKLYQEEGEKCLSSVDPKFPSEWLKDKLEGKSSNIELFGYKRSDLNKENPIKLQRAIIRKWLGKNNYKWKETE